MIGTKRDNVCLPLGLKRENGHATLFFTKKPRMMENLFVTFEEGTAN